MAKAKVGAWELDPPTLTAEQAATIAGVLTGARALLADEARWTQQVSARDAFHLPTGPCSPSACMWCVSGALGRASSHEMRDLQWSAAIHTLAAALPATFDPTCVSPFLRVMRFNDRSSHGNVLALLDRAILRLKAVPA